MSRKKTDVEKLCNVIAEVFQIINDHYDVNDDYHFLDEFNKAARKRKLDYVAFWDEDFNIKVEQINKEEGIY